MFSKEEMETVTKTAIKLLQDNQTILGALQAVAEAKDSRTDSTTEVEFARRILNSISIRLGLERSCTDLCKALEPIIDKLDKEGGSSQDELPTIEETTMVEEQ